MIVRTKPLKTKLKHTQDPLEDFKRIHHGAQHATQKEVIFVRYIGVNDSIKLFIDQLLQIEEYFSNISNSRYMRIEGLEKLSVPNDISRLSKIWEDWQTNTLDSRPNASALYETPLGTRLDNDSLEWTKKLLFVEIISTYKSTHPNSNETLFKNFAIKVLHWIELYLPKLFQGAIDKHISAKVIFIGDIKQHELLFLYFLSRLGCDICYMNPREDIVHLYPEVKKFSTLYKCKTVYSDQLTLPVFIPKSYHKDSTEQKRISHSIAPKLSQPKEIISERNELSYEQLANLANSVVMIKTLDHENKPICFGSGVAIHNKGYILTNLHVVEGGHHFSVLYENESDEFLTDHLIKYHPIYDLAVIKVDRTSAALPVKASGDLVRGQKIVAIGSPLGLFNSISDGIVSGFREINTIPMIQFTAPISDGSSGGALIDMYGSLVGLITAGFNQGQNLNLAVPSAKIYEFAQNFIEHID